MAVAQCDEAGSLASTPPARASRCRGPRFEVAVGLGGCGMGWRDGDLPSAEGPGGRDCVECVTPYYLPTYYLLNLRTVPGHGDEDISQLRTGRML